jgi:RNA polymerase sigma-70 factor (ECF subfamily)
LRREEVLSRESALDFARIYEEYHARVLSYVAKLIGRQEADDLTNEVFSKIARSLETLGDSSRLGSWIYAITLNTVRDAARARVARPDLSSIDRPSARNGADGADTASEVPDSAGRSAEETAIRNEMIACYLDYVRRLPPTYYQVYVLSEFDDLSNAEIADRLSLPVGTVKIRLHRARARLYEEIRRNCQCYHNERGELMAEPRGKANFSGEWTLNRQKSRLQLEALAKVEQAVLHIEHRASSFSLHRLFTIDGQHHEVVFDLPTDGSQVVRQEGERELRSRLGWETDILVFTTHIVTPSGDAINTVRYRMLPRGRQLEAAERYRGLGLSYDNLWVFDKAGAA